MEVWKDIPSHVGLYQCSNLGRIRSIGIDKFHKGKILKQRISNSGYFAIDLHKNKTVTTQYAHRLIAKTFIGNDENKEQVNHKDGNKLNNNIENLEWCTRSENHLHAYRELNRTNPMLGKTRIDNVHSKKVIGYKNEIYDSIKICAEKNKISYASLVGYLNGTTRNKTRFSYLK